MARLKAPAFPAGWLIVTLAVIVCAIRPCSSGSGDGMTEVERIKADGSTEKAEQLIERAKDCIRKLAEFRRLKKNRNILEQAVRTFDELRLSLKQLPNWDADDLDMPKSWLNLLSLREQTLECNDNSIQNILKQAKAERDNPWQFNYVLDCFRQHLVKCGYENQYKLVIDVIDKESRPTLHSFLEDVVWKQIEDKNSRLDYKLNRIFEVFKKTSEIDYVDLVSKLYRMLDVFKKIPKINNIHDEATCKSLKVRTELADLLAQSTVEPQLYSIMRAYFAVYLERCGFEDRFRKAMTEHGVRIDKAKSPLANYLWDDLLKSVSVQDLASEVSFALEVVASSEYIFNCNEETSAHISDLRLYARRRKYHLDSMLVKCLDGVSADYLNACIDQFRAKAEELKRGQNVALLALERYSARVQRAWNRYKDDPGSSRKIITGIVKDGYTGFEPGRWGHRGFSRVYRDSILKLEKDCTYLWGIMRPFIDAMKYDCTPATNDEAIMRFMDTIGYCFCGLLTKSDVDKRILEMFDILGAPYLPTNMQPERVVSENCRRW